MLQYVAIYHVRTQYVMGALSQLRLSREPGSRCTNVSCLYDAAIPAFLRCQSPLHAFQIATVTTITLIAAETTGYSSLQPPQSGRPTSCSGFSPQILQLHSKPQNTTSPSYEIKEAPAKHSVADRVGAHGNWLAANMWANSHDRFVPTVSSTECHPRAKSRTSLCQQPRRALTPLKSRIMCRLRRPRTLHETRTSSWHCVSDIETADRSRSLPACAPGPPFPCPALEPACSCVMARSWCIPCRHSWVPAA